LRSTPEHWQAETMPSAKQRVVTSRRRFRRRQKTVNTVQASKTATSVFIGRWTPKVLFSLKQRPYRHGQLRRQLGSISQRMLTKTLRNLESAGLIDRSVTQSKTIAVEYSLTQFGRTIIDPLRGMCRWAKRNRRRVSAEVRLLEAESG
jgi:DNA-binding HxlR family transcriptional regulator